MDNYKVSVVLLTKNSVATVGRSLESVLRQTRKPDEVVVVDGYSKNGTKYIVRQYPVKLISEPGLGFGYARNVGVQNARGDIVFFIDSDCYADSGWIEKMLHHFHNPEIAGVTGPTRLWNTGDPVARFLAYVRGRRDIPRQQGYIKIAPTMNLALRRNVILEVGGFDESLVRCEDTELTYKVTKRYRILYEPEAIVWFKGSQTLTMASSKCIRHFTGVGQLFAKHGFNPSFVRPDIPVRGIILIVATASVFFIPWYVPTSLFTWLFAEFVYNMVKMYWRYRDTCVFYYVVFFTFWSLVSMTILYGLCLGLKNKGKIVKRKKLK